MNASAIKLAAGRSGKSADDLPSPDPAGGATLLLSTEDLARELRTSTKTIARMDSAGRLPKPVKIGGRLKRWPRQAIVEWIAAGCPSRR
jgi:predicted DNA-binding transcriptional regulator AlpA